MNGRAGQVTSTSSKECYACTPFPQKIDPEEEGIILARKTPEKGLRAFGLRWLKNGKSSVRTKRMFQPIADQL